MAAGSFKQCWRGAETTHEDVKAVEGACMLRCDGVGLQLTGNSCPAVTQRERLARARNMQL